MTSYSAVAELPDIEEMELLTHTSILVANSRLDQGRVRAAVDAVFAAHPELGSVFDPFFDKWATHLGGSWGWAVEPPGVAVDDVVARHRGSFDMRTGRLFSVSLLPGAPERLVLTASCLCMDDLSWRGVVDDLVSAYQGAILAPEV